MTEVYNGRKCPECGGKLSHKLDCSKRDWRPSLLEQIKAPMTQAEAVQLSEELRAIDRPMWRLSRG